MLPMFNVIWFDIFKEFYGIKGLGCNTNTSERVYSIIYYNSKSRWDVNMP